MLNLVPLASSLTISKQKMLVFLFMQRLKRSFELFQQLKGKTNLTRSSSEMTLKDAARRLRVCVLLSCRC